MEIRAFNPIILYCCLFAEPTSVQLDGASINLDLVRFVDLYENPRRADNRSLESRNASCKNYLLGSTERSNRGRVPNSVKKFKENYNSALNFQIIPNLNEIKSFIDYKKDELLEKHKEYVIRALECDDNTRQELNNISFSVATEKWIIEIIRRCFPNTENYLYSTSTYKQIFAIIRTSVDNNDSVDQCRKKLEEYWKSQNEQATTEDVTNSSLSNLRNIAHTYFKKICSIGRFEKYWSEESDSTKHFIKNIDVSLKTSGKNGNKSISFEEVLFPSDKLPEQATSSISLCGKGGIGKTFLILRVMETIFKNIKYNNIIPLYIALQNVNRNYNGNVFKALYEEIKRYCGSNAISESEFEDFLRGDSNRVIVFADGMNEVTGDEERSALATSLTDMSKIYGVRICVSSRQNHVSMFNRLAGSSNFEDAEVNKLTQTQIEKYLSESGCIAKYSEIKHETQKLLETPQGLAMYSVLVGNDNSKINAFVSLGDLILAYSDLLLDINREEITDTSVLQFEELLEEIAYQWVRNSCFSGEITTDQKAVIQTRKNIKDIFTVTSGMTYEFSHQNFRDMYCARFLARQISKINEDNIEKIFDEYFNLNNSLVSNNDEILELVSSFVVINAREYDKEAIEVLRKAAKKEKCPLTDYAYPLSKLIRIHAFRRHNNISELDLSGLDLREVSLSGYQLYSYDKLKYTIFDGAKVNTSTFLKNGLDSASSAITKYEYKGKTYVVAFARTSIAVIDVAENQVKVVRNLPSNKWINCCYATEKNGEPIVYLGNENGIVSEFYPHMLYINQRYVKQDLPIESVGEIFSITGITLNNEEYIIFSSIQGDKGFLFAYKKYQVGVNKFIKKELPKSSNFGNHKFDYTKCKLTYSSKAGLIFVSFVDKIYVYDCKTLFSEISEPILQSFFCPVPELQLYSDENLLNKLNIKDIYACDFVDGDCIVVRLFINICSKIDLFEIVIKKDDANSPDLYKAHLLYRYDPANENNETDSKAEYTKFSPISIPNKDYKDFDTRVLVGIKVGRPYNNFYRFYELYCSNVEDPKKATTENKKAIATENVGNTYNGYATHAGVYYKLDNIGRRFLATVSDYRSIEIDCIGDEEYPKKTHYGAYNGVHYIDCSSDCNRMICGNYDGYVVELEKLTPSRRSGRESKWVVANAFNLHSEWVWKTLYLNDKCFVSCGYDGRLILTSKFDNKVETTYVINENEKLLDFCVSSKGNQIYVISESGFLYTVEQTKNDRTLIILKKVDRKKILDDANIKLRTIAIDDNDNHPILFYNKGKNTLGHIIKYSDESTHSDFINLNSDDFKMEVEKNEETETKYAYIRQMKFVKFDDFQEGYRCLIAVGDLHTKGIVLIADYATDSSGDTAFTKMTVHDSFTTEHGNINDFAVTKHGEKYVLWLAHKDSVISAYILTYENGKIKSSILKANLTKCISKTSMSYSSLNFDDYSKSVTNKISETGYATDDQPMCLKAYEEDNVLIGLLNGDVLQATLRQGQNGEFAIHFKYIIHTHADLNSANSVKLKKCFIEDKEEFKEQLDGYFNISD